MTEEIITLSQTELDRASVMQSIINRDLTQATIELLLPFKDVVLSITAKSLRTMKK